MATAQKPTENGTVTIDIEQKPKYLPMILLNISGLSTLIGSFAMYLLIKLGEAWTVADRNAKILEMDKAGNFALGSLFYLMLCIIGIDLWRSKKYWARWAILSLVIIHLSGWVYFMLYYGLLKIFGVGVCVFVPILCVAPIFLDLVVLYQIFNPKGANVKA